MTEKKAEAEKPIKEPTMRGDIEKQRHKMRKLLDALQEVARSEWDRTPKKFFKDVGEKMKKEGIDEMKFIEFISEELIDPLVLISKQDLKVWIEDVKERHKEVSRNYGILNQSKKESHVAKTYAVANQEKMIAREVITMAICIYEAHKSKQSCTEFFGAMNEDDAKGRIGENRKYAEHIISEVDNKFVGKVIFK